MDKIIIKDLRIYAYHGVNPEEKTDGQYFILDITCRLDLSVPCVTDNVDDTVSYAKIIKLVKKTFTAEKYNLIEKAAKVTADAILDEYSQISCVTVVLKKPDAPVKADFGYAAVEITADRSGKS
ncbi:MAG: dihydroneopterin aldolase [Clostridiales bacterium]|nr:dihydroneopterin aldolase [Clostridiales bacterium]MCD7827072.1 dihydroneopterin aldolase [Clostridiales bacterium]